MIKNELMMLLQEFLAQRGQSLKAYGSAEYALSRSDALQFVEMLQRLDGQPLGIERWKYLDGEPAIDMLGGWYCESSDAATNISAASEFLKSIEAQTDDVFAAQFN